MKRRALVLMLCTAVVASANYYWIQYPSRNGVSQPIYDRYDPNSLPDGHTLSFFINEPGTLQLAPNDSTTALLSQIRAAAAVWNTVDGSDLKLAFGGMKSASAAPMNSPWIEVEFSDELAPGIIALGGPTGRTDTINGASGPFTPIVKSLLRLPRNLTTRPSWGERLFLTLVHEFGHTLGLQHSWASGVMSTELTRATTKAHPLSADDAAGLSFLYPTQQFRQTTGTITGRVTMNNAGVHLASVVAYSNRGAAVSALSHPDGTYRLEGLAPGSYTVYVHPLPPALPGESQPVNLDLPTDPAGRILPSGAFEMQFYPGTATPQSTVTVTAEQSVANINFAVRSRAAVNLHTVQTYSFIGQDTAKPAVIFSSNGRGTVVFSGYGANQLGPNFSVNTIVPGDGVVSGSLRAYSAGYLQVDIAVSSANSDGPRPLLFTLGDEQYVLPSAYTVVSQGAPSIAAVTANSDRTVTLAGQNLVVGSRVWFDGVQARPRSADNGTLTVAAPPAPAGHRSAISVLNPDGQSTLLFSGPVPQFYAHESPDAASFTMNPAALAAGTETLVEMTASGVNLEDNPLTVNTGSSDTAIRRLWITGPNRALALVSVAPSAAPGSSSWTISAGLMTVNAQSPSLTLNGSRQAYLSTSSLIKTPLSQGAPVTVNIVNAPASAQIGSFSVTVADRPAQVLGYSSGQLTFQLPANLPSGPAIVRTTIGGDSLPPAVLSIATPPPVVLAAMSAGGGAVSTLAPIRPGDIVNLMISNLLEPGQVVESAKIRILSPVGSGIIEHAVQSVIPFAGQAGTFIVQVVLSSQSAGVTNLPLVVSADDRISSLFTLPYRP